MDEKRKKLDVIEFRFEDSDEIEWQRKYALAVKYYNHYGHSNIPYEFKTKDGITESTDEDAIKLGIWCSTKREDFKKETLSAERIKKLELINFRFETNLLDLEWQRKYALAVKYYNHYGHSYIPQNFKTKDGITYDEEGVALGRWCDNQRKKFKDYQPGIDAIMDERWKKLDVIEFRFKTKKETQAEKIELCNTYGIDFSKYKILDRMSYQELYAKIMFLLDSNLPLEIDGKLHPIFTMCNENMMINYGISKEELITNYYINRKGRK